MTNFTPAEYNFTDSTLGRKVYVWDPVNRVYVKVFYTWAEVHAFGINK